MKQTRTAMIMASTSATTAALLATSLIVGGGCAKPPPPPKPVPPPVWQAPTDRPAQARELVEITNAIEREINQLPGSSREEHRQVVSRLLKQLSRGLRLAQGQASSSPEFLNRIGVIDSSQAAIDDKQIEAARLEAAENEAVRSAVVVLDQIALKQLPDDERIKQLLQTTHGKLDAMYRTPGPMHDLVATDGFQFLSQVLRRVSDGLMERYGSVPTAPPPTGIEAPAPIVAPTPAGRPSVPPAPSTPEVIPPPENTGGTPTTGPS